MLPPNRRSLYAVVVLTAGVALAGCGGGATVRVAEATGTVHAHPGDTVVLTFGASPGIGFAWTLQSALPAGPLSLVSERFQAEHPDTVGGSGNAVFTFKARKAGAVKLTFRRLFRGRPLEQRDVAVVLA
jgi:predicted secreted protein